MLELKLDTSIIIVLSNWVRYFGGFMDKNFMATYLLGPLLPLNPLLTKNILAKLGITNPRLSFEKEAMKAYEIRLKEFENEQTELS